MGFRELVGMVFIPGMILGGTVVCSFWRRGRDLCFLAMLAFIPLTEYYDINYLGRDWYRGTVRGFEVGLVDVLACVVLLSGWLSPRPGQRRWFWPASLGLILLYFFYCAFNVGISTPKLFGLYELSKILRAIIMFLAAAWYIQSERELRIFVAGLAIVIMYQGYHAVSQRYLYGVHRVFGTFLHPNSLSVLLCATAPLFVAAFNSQWPKWLKGLCGLALASAGVSIILTISRAGLMVLAVVLVAAALATMTWKVTLRKIAICLVVAIGVGGLVAKSWETLKARFSESNLEEEYENRRNLGRGYYIRIATAIVQEQFFGVGLNNWSYWVSNKYGPKLGYRFVPYKGTDVVPSEKIPETSNVDVAQAAPAHSLLALTAGELGIPGLLFMLLMWLRWFQMGAVFLWSRSDDPRHRLGVGIFFGLAGLFLQSVTEWVFRQSAISYMAHLELGVLAALYALRRRELAAEDLDESADQDFETQEGEKLPVSPPAWETV
jgi:O-antigen ligase